MLRPWDMQVWLDKEDGRTLHIRLLERFISDIKNGRLSPGSMLPGSRTLAKQLGVNRKTVQQVFEELEAQGWIESRPRRGTFVTEILPEQDLSTIDKELVQNTHRTLSSSRLLENLYENAIEHNEQAALTNDGTPDARLIPYELLARTYRKVCINLSRQSKLGYGDPRGSAKLRNSIKGMLAGERFMSCLLEQICLVRGSQMGIYLASRVLDPKNGAIVVEELNYSPARAAFEANGFKILKCRLDNNGIDIENLRSILQRNNVAGIYVTPHHQYPTTVCLPMERRLALLELSKQYKFAIIEDDYDHEFHYESKPIPPLASLPNSENVVHIGSMSKVFAPGLRVGYLAASVQFIKRASQEIVLIDRQGNTLSEHVMAELLESGEVKRHIRKTRKQYKERRDFAAREFHRVFGDHVSFEIPTGGLAIWVNITKLTAGRSLSLGNGNDSTLSTFYGDNNHSPGHLRFGFGAINNQEITRSIEKLATLLIA